MSKKQTIIIKKVKKGHGGHHGGAWKVAYADFVTAMMAFFLLMWLLQMSSQELRVKLAYYYKNFSIFKDSGGGGNSFLGQQSEVTSMAGQGKEKLNSPSEAKAPDGMKGTADIERDKIREQIKFAITQRLGEEIGEQVLFDTVEGGLRIQLVDREGRAMFELGSAAPRPITRDLINVISGTIQELRNRIVVEGHTDSYGFKKKTGVYDNWQLSADRANATRKLLEEGGVDDDRISRVAGYADKEMLVPDVPMDPRNRRISIILLDDAMRNELKSVFDTGQGKLKDSLTAAPRHE